MPRISPAIDRANAILRAHGTAFRLREGHGSQWLSVYESRPGRRVLTPGIYTTRRDAPRRSSSTRSAAVTTTPSRVGVDLCHPYGEEEITLLEELQRIEQWAAVGAAEVKAQSPVLGPAAQATRGEWHQQPFHLPAQPMGGSS